MFAYSYLEHRNTPFAIRMASIDIYFIVLYHPRNGHFGFMCG